MKFVQHHCFNDQNQISICSGVELKIGWDHGPISFLYNPMALPYNAIQFSNGARAVLYDAHTVFSFTICL